MDACPRVVRAWCAWVGLARSCRPHLDVLEAAVGIVRGTGPFGADHARAHRVLGRADSAEELAVHRLLHAAQYRAALAGLVVGHGAVRDTEAKLGIVLRVLRLDAQRG